MNCIVTGGAGFIGSHLAERLVRMGHTVVVIDRFSPGKPFHLAHLASHPRLTLVKRNICENLADIFGGRDIEVIFHMAAMPKVQYSIEHPLETHEANVNGTLNVLEHARQYGVRRVVFSSTCAVYGNQPDLPFKETSLLAPISPYALHKVCGEQYASLYYTLYGLETISLRYFNAFGPRQDIRGSYANLIGRFSTRLLAKEQPIIYGDGKQTRDFIYVADVVDANIKAATIDGGACLGQSINIGSGANLSVNDILDRLTEIHGGPVAPMFESPRVEIRHAVADISKARALLGWRPTTPLDVGLRETYLYFKSISLQRARGLDTSSLVQYS